MSNGILGAIVVGLVACAVLLTVLVRRRPLDPNTIADVVVRRLLALPRGVVTEVPAARPDVFGSQSPRFYIQAIDSNGNETDESWRGDDEREAKRLWEYFTAGKQYGVFTFYDRRHTGHRGQVTRR